MNLRLRSIYRAFYNKEDLSVLTLRSKGRRWGDLLSFKTFYQEDFLVDIGNIKCQVRLWCEILNVLKCYVEKKCRKVYFSDKALNL